MRIAIVALLAVTGCLERPTNETFNGPPGQREATEVANTVLAEYGLRPIQPGWVDVTWMLSDDGCLDGVDESIGCVSGAHYGLCTIWMIGDSESKWSDSPFGHEIVHCSILGDDKHLDPIWPELVRVIRERLADAGL